MSLVTKALILVVGLSLAACTNPNRFGNNGGADGAGGNGAGGIDQTGLGDASNPASPAYFKASIGDTIRFPVDQSIISGEAQATLAAQAGWLNANPSYMALIEGHADEQGTRGYNLNLGERRANAVREYLISQGVSATRITTISYGKERPLAVCSDEACYAQNRRAVTVLTAGLTS
jgi:peptidoglycan-associated lipoprotein